MKSEDEYYFSLIQDRETLFLIHPESGENHTLKTSLVPVLEDLDLELTPSNRLSVITRCHSLLTSNVVNCEFYPNGPVQLRYTDPDNLQFPIKFENEQPGKFLKATGLWLCFALIWTCNCRLLGPSNSLKYGDFHDAFKRFFPEAPEKRNYYKDNMLKILQHVARWKCDKCHESHLWGRDAPHCPNKEVFPRDITTFIDLRLITEEITAFCFARSNLQSIQKLQALFKQTTNAFTEMHKIFDQVYEGLPHGP